MSRPRVTLILLSLLTVTVGQGVSLARAADAARGDGRIVLAQGGISLNQAISMVERRFKARVVRSDVRQEGGRTIYVLRLLDDSGNAQVVRVDAQTGAIT